MWACTSLFYLIEPPKMLEITQSHCLHTSEESAWFQVLCCGKIEKAKMITWDFYKVFLPAGIFPWSRVTNTGNLLHTHCFPWALPPASREAWLTSIKLLENIAGRKTVLKSLVLSSRTRKTSNSLRKRHRLQEKLWMPNMDYGGHISWILIPLQRCFTWATRLNSWEVDTSR